MLSSIFTALLGIFLLTASYGHHSYGYYTILRLLTALGAAYWVVTLYQYGSKGWTWLFGALVVLFNPIFPVRMHRQDWQPIDLWLGFGLLLWSGYWLLRKGKRA